MGSLIMRILVGALLGFVFGTLLGALILEIVVLATFTSQNVSAGMLLEVSYIVSACAIAGALIQAVRAGWRRKPADASRVGGLPSCKRYVKRFGAWLALVVLVWAAFGAFSSSCRCAVTGLFTGQRYYELEPSGYWRRVLAEPNGRHADAIRALEKIGPDEDGVVLALAGALKNPDRDVRRQAVRVLTEFGPKAEAARPALIEAMQDPDAEIRRSAPSALAMVVADRQSLLPLYLNALGDPDRTARAYAIGGLGALGPAAEVAVGPLVKIVEPSLKDSNYQEAANALIRIGRPAVPELCRLMQNSGGYSVRLDVAQILARMGPDAIPGLIESLQDKQNMNRRYAAFALGRLQAPDARVVTALTGALSDADEPVRIWAIEALGDLGPAAKDAVPDLQKAQKADDAKTSAAARKALVRVHSSPGPATVDEIVKDLTGADKTPEWLSVAAELSKHGAQAKAAVPALLLALQDAEDARRFAAALALARIDPEATDLLPVLRQALGKSDRLGVRTTVAEVLGERGTAARAALPELFEVMQDKNSYVAQKAARAIWLIDRDKRAVPVSLNSSTLPSFAPYEDDAIPFLIEALQDRTPLIRDQAPRVLGQMGPKAKAAVPALVNAKNDSSSSFFADDRYTEALERIEPGKVFQIRLQNYIVTSLIAGSAIAMFVFLVAGFVRVCSPSSARRLPPLATTGDGPTPTV